MFRCWSEDPLKRPTFTELRVLFENIISEGGNYVNFNVNENEDYYTVASFKSCENENENENENEVPIVNPMETDVLIHQEHEC